MLILILEPSVAPDDDQVSQYKVVEDDEVEIIAEDDEIQTGVKSADVKQEKPTGKTTDTKSSSAGKASNTKSSSAGKTSNTTPTSAGKTSKTRSSSAGKDEL